MSFVAEGATPGTRVDCQPAEKRDCADRSWRPALDAGNLDVREAVMSKRKRTRRAARERGGMVMGIAWYRRGEWPKLLAAAADRDQLEETYDEWLQSAQETLGATVGQGPRIQESSTSTWMHWSPGAAISNYPSTAASAPNTSRRCWPARRRVPREDEGGGTTPNARLPRWTPEVLWIEARRASEVNVLLGPCSRVGLRQGHESRELIFRLPPGKKGLRSGQGFR